MLHEMRAARGSDGPSMSQSGPTDTMGLIAESSHINTRSIHQLHDTSQITSQQEVIKQNEDVAEEDPNQQEDSKSERKIEENEAEGDKKSDKGEGDQELKKNDKEDENQENIKTSGQISPNKQEKKSDTKLPGGRVALVRKQEEEAKAKELELKIKEDKMQYILDMFGSDFSMKLLSDGSINYDALKVNQFKDEAMKALQEKSFHGLYLRLQFWINQIYKRLHSTSQS